MCVCVCVQAVEWLGELLDALLKTHVRLGEDTQETRTMLDKHRKFVDVAQVRFDLMLMLKISMRAALKSSFRSQLTINNINISASDTLPE